MRRSGKCVLPERSGSKSLLHHPACRALVPPNAACANRIHPESHRRHLEQQANNFAFNILMPEWSVRVSVDYIGAKVSKLASYYSVSEAAMEMRLRQLYR